MLYESIVHFFYHSRRSEDIFFLTQINIIYDK